MEYFFFTLEAILPVAVAIGFYFLKKKTKFGKLNFWISQLIIGLVFGGVAVLGTECGIHVNNLTINVRDAAPMIAGFFFGAPAGVLAGLIGGIERYFASFWGAGEFTRIACMTATICAGCFAGICRITILHKKNPNFLFAGLCAVWIEVFHMLLVYLTNLDNVYQCVNVFSVCTLPMVLGNFCSVASTAIIFEAFDAHYEKHKFFKKTNEYGISNKVQFSLVVIFVLSFLGGAFSIYNLQSKVTKDSTEQTLSYAALNVSQAFREKTNNFLLNFSQKFIEEYFTNGKTIKVAAELSKGYEIYVLNENNFITDSNNVTAKGKPIAYFTRFTDELLNPAYGEPVYEDYYGTSYLIGGDLNRYISRLVTLSDGSSRTLLFSSSKTTFNTYLTPVIKDINIDIHFANTGEIYLLSSDYVLVNTSKTHTTEEIDKIESDLQVLKTSEQKELLQFDVMSVSDYGYHYADEDYFIVSVATTEEMNLPRKIAMFSMTYALVLIMGVIFLMAYIGIDYIVLKKMDKVNASLEKITKGDLNEVLQVRDSKEFAELSDDINSTVDKLKTLIDEEKKRLDAELKYAKEIQLSSLPPQVYKNEFISIAASTEPAKTVGGDFYDYYHTKDHSNFHCLIADVSGKGIPAALFMMKSKTILKSTTRAEDNYSKVFIESNDVICRENTNNMFVTAWQCGIDTKTGLAKFVNAGHNSPFISKKGQQFTKISCNPNLPLGCFDSFKFSEQKLKLEPGDTLFLYTDGLDDAINPQGEHFGEENILKMLNDNLGKEPEELVKSIKETIKNYSQDAEQFDDITMLVMKVNKLRQ